MQLQTADDTAEAGPTVWMMPRNHQLPVEARRQSAELVQSKNNRLELGHSTRSIPKTKRHRSSLIVKPEAQRRKSNVTTELTKELRLIKRNIWSLRPWTESFCVMGTMAFNGSVSLLAALTVAAMYANATPTNRLEQQKPSRGSSIMLVRPITPVLVTIYFVSTASFAYIYVFAFIFIKGPSILHQPTLPAYATSVPQAMRRLAKESWHVLLLTLGLSSGFTVLSLFCQANLRLQVYGVSCITQLVPIHVSKQLKQLYLRREAKSLSTVSMESQDSTPSSSYSTVVPISISSGPTGSEINRRRFEFSLRDRLLPLMSLLIGVVYLHLSLALDLTARWQRFAFVCGSLMLRVILQEAAKRLLLDTRMPPAIVISVVMIVPTVVIDVQIRMAFIRLGIGQSLVSISLALVLVEVFVRVTKILYLRHAIVKRLAQCKSMRRLLERVNSRISAQDIRKARQEYALYIEWKKYLLHCHAAEVYADMYGEYIAIGCSTAVLQLLGRRAEFDLAPFLRIPMRDMLIIAGFQTGTGLVFDWLLNVVETLHEVPLHSALDDADSTVVRRFLCTLAAILAAVNVGLVALFAVEIDGHVP